MLLTQEKEGQQEEETKGRAGRREKEEKAALPTSAELGRALVVNHKYYLLCWGSAPNIPVHIYTAINPHHSICPLLKT